jgi:hypothetical protein
VAVEPLLIEPQADFLAAPAEQTAQGVTRLDGKRLGLRPSATVRQFRCVHADEPNPAPVLETKRISIMDVGDRNAFIEAVGRAFGVRRGRLAQPGEQQNGGERAAGESAEGAACAPSAMAKARPGNQRSDACPFRGITSAYRISA